MYPGGEHEVEMKAHVRKSVHVLKIKYSEEIGLVMTFLSCMQGASMFSRCLETPPVFYTLL